MIRIFHVFVFCVLSILTGCGGSAYQTFSDSNVDSSEIPKMLSSGAVVLAVPLVFQTEKFECGLTSLTMLFAYYGREVANEDTLRFKEKAENEEGIVAHDLSNYLLSQNFDSYIFKGELSKEGVQGVYAHLDKGRPLVVMIASGRDRRHYVLLTGYDKEKSLVVLQDPVRGAILVPEWQFDVLWKYCDYFTLLTVPKDEEIK